MTSATKTRIETCTVCGKEMTGSRSWGPELLVSWYCSKRCSEIRLAPLDYRLQDAIFHLLGRSSRGESLALEEVAIFVDPLGWESLMERARNAARRLAARGLLSVEGSDTDDAFLWGADEMRLQLPS